MGTLKPFEKRAISARRLAARMGADVRGNVAMIFALVMPALVMITLCGVDIHRMSTVKSRLQDALDAAALAAARSPFTDPEDLKRVGMIALNANLRNSGVDPADPDAVSFALTDDQVVIADARVELKTLVANIFLPPYGKLLDDTLPVATRSEVNRSSKNIEVAMVLDITGSMSGSRLNSLKDAARQLAAIVVQDQQEPYYTRMAVVPYSTGVNLGNLANRARGVPTPSVNITDISWSAATPKSITAVTRASTGYVTAANHAFKNGDFVWIQSVKGMTQLNNKAYRVANASTNTFSLQTWTGSSWQNLSTSSYSTYSSAGTVTACRLSDCTLVVTAPQHGIAAEDPATGTASWVRFTDVGGLTQINGGNYEIANVTTDAFSINVVGPPAGAYTSGGRVWCGNDGCQWRIFRNTSNQLRIREISTCATERSGANRYTDASPGAAPVGRFYPNPTGSDRCTSAELMPLTDNRDDIYALIGRPNVANEGLQAAGYTAAQIGLAWGWYAVSPNFNTLWTQTPAAAYDPRRTLKAVVLMTDGEFNAPYCSGALARDASYGGERITCNADNGDPYTQSRALCSAIKDKDIILYTVGFQVSANSNAGRFLRDCATSPTNFFLPASGADLTESFKAIGRDITRLRISR